MGLACFGQHSIVVAQPPQTPQSDTPKAHVNVESFPINQTQEMSLQVPLPQVRLKSDRGASTLQMISLPSDQPASSSDIIARFALATGSPLPEGAKLIAHTDVKLLGKVGTPSPIPLSALGNDFPHGNGTPNDIITRYNLRGGNSTGALIIIVDAYRYPTAESDLAQFSQQYDLPSCSVESGCLTIKLVDPARTLPDTDPRVSDCGWSVESALDLQWAHAIARNAHLVLVEAASSDVKDLFAAIDTATLIAEQAGGGIVSLSWSIKEFDGEAAYDQHFISHDHVLYFGASGDQGGVVEYPAASPFVIAVGGTMVARDQTNAIVSEVGWDLSGGGTSGKELRPSLQNILENISSTTGRAAPDIAGPAGIDRNLDNGSPLFAGTVCSQKVAGWYAVGGTSLATPIIAAAAALSLPKGASTAALLANIYAQRKNPANVKDIVSGQAGSNFAKQWYDTVTGVGVPASINFVLPMPAVPTPP